MSNRATPSPLLQALRSDLAALASVGDVGAQVRQDALVRLESMGLPTPRDEAWRFTNLASLVARPWRLSGEADASEMTLETPFLEGPRLVFVDGVLAPWSASDWPDGVEFSPPGGLAADEEDPVVLLSTVALTGGGRFTIAAGRDVDRPLHIQLVSTPRGAESVNGVRFELRLEESASATVVVDRTGHRSGAGLTTSVVDVDLAANARLQLTGLGREPEDVTHLGEVTARVARDANFQHRSLVVGGGLVRQRIGASLVGTGAECRLDGLVVAHGNQHVDHQIHVSHRAEHTRSHQNYRNILDGAARGVFSGRVHVAPGAQKTDATQNNRNLLLSDDAVMNTMPQLEIYADDVKASHGATLGRLDERALFYLRSRGIDETAARNLLLFAFASEILDEIQPPALLALVRQEVLRRLPRQALLEEVG